MIVKKIFVVGAGTMGSGITQVAASSGFDVIINDINEQLALAGKTKIQNSLAKLVARGKIQQDEMDATLSRIQTSSSYEDAADADLIIESASENIEIKLKLFEKLSKICKNDAILASNTSSISITSIAGATSCTERVVGMHFFNPAPVMKLLEIVRGLQTSDETIAIAKSVGEKLGKVTVIAKDSPGFIVNRLLDPMLNEAAFLVHEGVATPEDIDKAMVNGLNHPMGPCALSDMIGIDVMLSIMDVFFEEYRDPKYRACPLLRQMVAAGHLGRKSGKGFFEYDK